jgi:aspartate aminotransferase
MPNLTLSPIIGDSLTPSPTLYINERVKAMWAAGETVYHLGFGESRFPVPAKMRQALADNAHRNSYLPGLGIPELRQTAARYYSQKLNIHAEASQVMVAPGSKALLYAMNMALDGDVILPTPSWVSYAPQAQLLGKPILRIPADPAQHHRLSLDAFAETLAQSTARQHVMVINSPNNPSGGLLSGEELRALADFCRANQVIVLSDELYGLIPHTGKRHHTLAEFYPEGTVILSGLSKHLSLGGWRLGLAIVPAGEMGQRLLAAANKIGSEIWSCAPAPMQYAALTAYSGDPEIESFVADSVHLHTVRTRYLWEQISELDIDCAEPSGGFYLFPNFDQWKPRLAQKGIHTSDDLARHLLDEWQIATLPGSVFGTPPQELSLRLSASYLDMETEGQAQTILDLHRSGLPSDELVRHHQPHTQAAIGQMKAFIASLSA